MFLDTKRLQDGRDFRADFSYAICRSLVIVPIISSYALLKLQKATETGPVDNMIAEWVISLVLGKMGEVKIFPIMIGEMDESTSVRQTYPCNIDLPGKLDMVLF